MKKRDDIQTFHTPARVAVGSARILSPPQQLNTQNLSGGNASQNQYQIVNVLRDSTGSSITSNQNQSIQYTYTSPSVTVASPLQKSNITQQQQTAQSQALHLGNNINITNRTKTGSGSIVSSSSIPISVSSPTGVTTPQSGISGQNFPRLKVEDALSYLDQVKYKFGNQPQVYNDFLDIMKEFKSQSIDTPGVIQRVSNLFKGHPELIVGFNTFLPPGYKIEVQANDQGFAYQVSVSVPSPSGNATISTQHSPPTKFVQGSHTSIQQTPINIIPQAQGNLNLQQTDQKPSGQNVSTSGINISQNFNRERSNITPNISSNCQSSQQQQHSQISVQNTSMPTTGVVGDSSSLHRIQPIFQNDNQPVQFNQAIVYVNKIKCRFQEQPEKYKHFLRILHKYQNEQRRKDGKGGSPLTESEVFKQVAHLFDNQEDLLREFGQFLPDASPISANVMLTKNISSESIEKLGTLQGNQPKPLGSNNMSRGSALNPLDMYHNNNSEKEYLTSNFGNITRADKDLNRNNYNINNQKFSNIAGPGLKRSSALQLNHFNRVQDRSEPPTKRHKTIFRDISYADAARSGTLQDYAFFDKVRESLRSPDVYDNFLRCLTLYNQEIVSKTELITLVTPFLSKEPELLKKFHDFLKYSSGQEPIPISAAQRHDQRSQTDIAAEIDVAQCKRLGTSYCALPKSSEPKKCSGRTALCREVLNDVWVSFPSWSEDSTFNTSRKTQYEEFIYRCEDERFELDVVIETNSATIRVLEGVQKKMSKMSADELGRFKLDDCLGGTSYTIHQRALRRIYADKSLDIIEGLKKNPNVAVPVVLRRLKAKEEEWREAQKSFNQQWREQNEKYYLKSLDHQGMNFKHADIKALRSKSLMNQIETAYEERNEGNNAESGPHMVLHYKDKSILDDATNLLIHHVKRQTGIQKLEKARIKHILRQFIPELFFAPRQPLSDDEKDDVFPFAIECEHIPNKLNEKNRSALVDKNSSNEGEVKNDIDENTNIQTDIKIENDNLTNSQQKFGFNSKHPEEAYTLFFANSNWYYFLRLHAILCERLRTIYERTQVLAAEEETFKTNRRESVAVALRLKPQSEYEIPDYYPAFLDMLKSLLDGNMDATTYEDKLRDMYGIHAYIAFTLDRVVSNAVRQLQFCVTERNALDCFELYQLERRNQATGGLCLTTNKRSAAELSYQRRTESSLQEETYFKILVFKIDCRVTIEMLENDTEDASTLNYEQDQLSSKYIERFTNPLLNTGVSATSRNNSLNGELEIKKEKIDKDLDSFMIRKPLYLQRNIRSFNKKIQKQKHQNGDDQEISTNTSSIDASSGKTNNNITVNENNDSSKSISNVNPERITRPHLSSNYFVDDQEQVKLSYQSYKTVFCNTTNKGYILYRYNSLKRAKQTHMNVTKKMSEDFNNFLEKWQSQNSDDSQKILIVDWLTGKDQADFYPCKTIVKKSTNIQETPYKVYNRYVVEYIQSVGNNIN